MRLLHPWQGISAAAKGLGWQLGRFQGLPRPYLRLPCSAGVRELMRRCRESGWINRIRLMRDGRAHDINPIPAVLIRGCGRRWVNRPAAIVLALGRILHVRIFLLQLSLLSAAPVVIGQLMLLLDLNVSTIPSSSSRGIVLHASGVLRGCGGEPHGRHC